MSQNEINHAASLADRTTLRSYRRRMLLVGLLIFALSLLAGIFISFHLWEWGSPFEVSKWEYDFNPISRATYGPLVFGLMVFPVTFPVLFGLAIPIYFGLKKPTRWPLVLLGFVAMGILWLLWITELWKMD